MVTNGGYGRIHFALTHGVPLVGGGQSEDKTEICARIAWSGVGVNLKTTAPTPSQIRNAVCKVLDERSYRVAALRVRDELARHDAPTEAADLLEGLGR